MAFGLLNDIVITQKNYMCLSTDTKPTSNIEGSATCYETDTLDLYEFDGAAWVKIRTTNNNGDPAANVVAELTNLANTIGLYTPAQRIYTSWLFGADDVDASRTVAQGADESVYTDFSLLNADNRSIVIVNSSGSGTLNWNLYFSRNGVGSADDEYEVASDTGTSGIVSIPIPATYGWDKFLMLKVTPVTATQTYKVYLTGRGG